MTSPVSEPVEAGVEGPSLPILEAKHVYILMSKDHRISRNRRAEWFFSRFQSLVTLPKDAEITSVEESGDFHVVSAIPSDSPSEWSPVTRHSYRYRITTKTIVTYLSRRYRIVYCIDVSPSVAAVDVQAGTVVFDRIFQTLRSSLDGLMRPFFIPGSTTIFQPKIFITVITHSPFIASVDDEVILQGKLLTPSTYGDILKSVFQRLNSIENKMAEMTSSLLHTLNGIQNNNDVVLFDGDEYSSTPSKSSIAVSSDFSLVDLLKQALIALSLLPENSSSGLVILTDGVVSVPDGRYLDIILSQLRYNTVSCSFIQLSSPFHPHLCHGALPYADLMKFIASATFGAFLTEAPEITDSVTSEMNVYHQAFLAWSFQSSDPSQTEPLPPAIAKPGEWSIRNKCFFTVRDMPIVKKQQYENSLAVDYMKVLSCRLREGFMIKEISLTADGQYEIKLTLPWKFLIHLEYVLVTNKDPQSKVSCILSLEGPYDFLHDVTCLAGRAFPSFYRQLMVNRFWATRKNLSESDRLLVHLNSFSSNPAYYNIPDSLRNGVPLFYFSSSTSSPVLQSSDFPYPQFAQFWKPVCMLDTTVWQKWMHTHRIGIILEHDHPLPKHLHFPNSTGRFHVILCRQAVMALNTLLKDMSSFVLVENHSYVTLMYSKEDEKIPFSFYIIRVTSKPPYVVLRLAFLVGTPGNLRHQTVSVLRGKISSLTFPQRLKEPPRWRFPTNVNPQASEQSLKATWSDMPCCILMQKMIEKILIRYEKVPENFCKVLMSQNVYESVVDHKSSASKQSTFGFRPTHPNPLAATTIMVPEMFNTVARYLHHRRWIWRFPKSLLPNLCLKDASEILSTVTKIRLQEGFRFAYSSAGTVSMVLEVQMQNEISRATYELSETLNQPLTQETYFTPCVVQFVVFPPVTSLTGNFEGESEAFEDANDLYFITEIWVEPQCGSVSSCSFSALNDLQFFEVPDKILEINQECFLTLGTFEYLKGICDKEPFTHSRVSESGNSSAQRTREERLSHQGSIRIIPFEFELGRVLPKCQQSEILFSMFYQDLSQAFSAENVDQFLPFHERANELLHNTWSSNLAFIHDKEIKVDSKHFEEILRMVLSREEGNFTEPLSCAPEVLPAWRCFVRAVDTSQLLITLMPKTLRDTKMLFMSLEKTKNAQNISSETSELERFSLAAGNDLLYSGEVDFPWVNEKRRRRKNSEPNCVKLGSTSLAASLALEVACINGGRKRIRACSGGDSAPVFKKAYRVQSAFNEIFCHTFDESSSKYIVPKDSKSIFDEDLQNSEISEDRELEHNLNASSEDSKNVDEIIDGHEEASKPPVEGNPFMIGSLTMPLFVYDCSLSSLRDHVIFKGSSEVSDACFDFRIFKADDSKNDIEFGNDEVESPSRSSDCTSQEAKVETPEIAETPEMSLKVFCKELQLAFKSSYIRSVFESLQLGYYVSSEDLRAVIKLCHKDTVQIDITEFMKCVCMHLNGPDKDSCYNMSSIHHFIKRKFQDILSKDFNIVKVDSNLFFFKYCRSHRSYENVFNLHTNSDGTSNTSYFDSHIPTRKQSISSEYYRLSESSTRRDSEDKDSSLPFPLFMHLRCSVYNDGEKRSVMVSDLPICIDDLDVSIIQDILEQKDADSWKIKLELIFLTSPSDETGHMNSTPVENDNTETLPCLPYYQTEVIKSAINEIQWLLDDEITSFRSKSNTLTADILKDIANHVERSAGKLGCFQQYIHLKFVNNAQVQGHDNFIERFNKLSVDGHALKKLENWWYLMETASSMNSSSMERSNDDVFLGNSVSESFESTKPLIQPDSRKSIESGEDVHLVLPFWMIFRVEQDQVVSYCHTRYNEADLAPLNRCSEVRASMLNAVVGLIRIVNQDLLLQSLHETKNCSLLLESAGIRELHEESSSSLFASGNLNEGMRTESDMESPGGQNLPGTFSCDVVWETTFKLHPRLRSGPGKSAFARGIQILRSTLIALEVNNRENMFVYRDSNGNVFYLRLYRVYETLDDSDDLPSENPSPRSSISSKSRALEMAERQNKEDIFFGILQAPPSSPRDRISDGVVLLKVHGVTEAGIEIKEHLIQSLRNKLDDAVLDVLSVTLDRNPHCKLTPEDVHFIQRPNSSPDAIFKFTTGRFTKLLLPAFAFYLHQNLLQFLNIPKYTRQESDYHFKDFLRTKDGQTLEEQNVYLYNQSPGGTGSRGVACVAVALVDKSGSRMRCHDWKRPSDFRFSLGMDELSTFIQTEEVVNGNQSSDVMVELCVWKQGRINLEILKNNFCSAIMHGGWDLAMEFQVLTPPLRMDEESDPKYFGKINIDESSERNSSGQPLKRRNSSVSQADAQESQVSDEQSRGRSWSYTVGKNSRPRINVKRSTEWTAPPTTNTVMGGAVSSETMKSSMDTHLKYTRRGYREDFERLNPNYGTLMKRWCNLGTKLNIPSLRIVSVSLKPRHYLDETVTELGRIISSVAPDNVTTQFWKLDRSMREFLTIGDSIHPRNREIIDQIYKEAITLKANDVKLQMLEESEESEYPEELLSLFRTKAHFKPSDANIMCTLIARNVTHWQTCISSYKSLDPSFHIPEVMKSIYKFSPMISEMHGPLDDKISMNAEKIKFNIQKGLLALITEPRDESHCMLVPRQRFLLATVTKTSIEFLFYNWSKESSDRLTEQTKLLAQWTQNRMQVLSSVLLQKSGLFYNQPFLRHSRIQDPNAPAFGGADIKDVILSSSPVKASSGFERPIGRKNHGSKTTAQALSDIYRNLHHAYLQCYPNDLKASPMKTHGEQTLLLLNSGKKEVENSLFRYWLSRGPSASNVIGMEAIEAFKQAARTIHYCMTPIIFLPRWRNAVALTRDSTVGLFKRARIVDSEKSTPAGKLDTGRSRYVSGHSDRSSRPNSNLSKSPIWSVWKRTYSSLNQDQDWRTSSGGLSRTLKKADESWHLNLCTTFLQEYMQYLQTLGFIPTHNNSGVAKRKQPMLTSETWTASYVGRLERVRRMSDGSVLSSDSEKTFASTSPSIDSPAPKSKFDIDEKIFYLQKSLPGGIILLEVGLAEPFCYCKIHALEAHRIQQSKSSRKSAASQQNTLMFTDECDKMKVLMHLHSFAYDFHLRWLHSYICGKQLIFKQGYHLTKFIDDFISYYCKGPNFARNTVHLGVVALQNMSTPSHILFNYILSHDKTYQMNVIRMIPLIANKNLDFLDPLQVNEYILVYSLSKKVVYKESEDENYYDEFDMSLMIAHDSPLYVRPYSVDPSVLRMKYYIVLTSRRELYPKVVTDPNFGKLHPVTAPEPLCVSQNRPKKLHKPSVVVAPIRETSPSIEKDATNVKDPVPSSSGVDVGPDGIREEKIRYMGYFSSHEQMMQQIVKEQTEWSENFIRTVVGKAAVDCRRDLLWQRLLVGGKFQDRFKKKKEDLTIRETVGVLSFWEFSELLELVRVEPLRTMDPRLKILLKQPVSFFQSLIKLLTYGNQYQHRHFIAPDGSVHQLTIINPNMNKSVVMVEMNLETPSCDLSVVFKEFNEAEQESDPQELDSEILNLIETVISACCYCDWINVL